MIDLYFKRQNRFTNVQLSIPTSAPEGNDLNTKGYQLKPHQVDQMTETAEQKYEKGVQNAAGFFPIHSK